ncbi:MAG: hypothetical protein H8F28_27595 [Fibrella sp.]|nr:hypothetical protein [Armatimonadota bacterium]
MAVSDNGEDDVTDANIALRVNIRPGRQSFTRTINVMNLGFGVQHDADAKDRLTQLFLTGDLFLPVEKPLLGFIGSQLITVSPIYQFSRKTIEGEADPETGVKPTSVTNVDGLTGLIQWEPELRFGNLITGQYLPRKAMVNQKDLRFYVLPRLAAEFSSIARESASATNKNVNYLRYDFLAGLAYQSVTLQYVHHSYRPLNSGFNDHSYETVALTIPLNPQKTFSLVTEYQNGEKSPEFQRTKEWTVGLGAKF